MKKGGLLLVVLLVAFSAVGQVNRTDEKGRKQGRWIGHYENTRIKRYEGTFKDDKPFGKMRYFFTKGTPQAILDFEADGVTAMAVLYHETGNVMAEGRYVNQVKVGPWKYYDAGGHPSTDVTYADGKKDGERKIYFDNGALAEVSHWKMDVQVGAWKTYYENKQSKEEGNYVDGNLDGDYVKYHNNGNKLVEGKYQHAVKNGGWKYYYEDGSLDYQELWKNGKVVKQVKTNGRLVSFYDSEKKKSEYNYRAGKKHGEFFEWHDNGEFVKELRPGDPNLDSKDEWVQSLKGQTMSVKGNYHEGKLNGKVYYWNEAGVQTKVEVYEHGTLVDTRK